MAEVKKILFDGLSFVILFLAITIIFCNGLVIYTSESPIKGRTKSFPFVAASLMIVGAIIGFAKTRFKFFRALTLSHIGVTGSCIVFILASVIMINIGFNKALLIFLIVAEIVLIINFMASLYVIHSR